MLDVANGDRQYSQGKVSKANGTLGAMVVDIPTLKASNKLWLDVRPLQGRNCR